MLIKDYFVRCMQAKRYEDRKWLVRTCSVLLESDSFDEYPKRVGNQIGFLENNETIILEDAVIGQPILGINIPVELPAGTLSILKEPLTTTYRHCILNGIILEYPFGDKFPYYNEKFTTKYIDKFCETHLREKTISIDEYKKVFRSMLFIDFLADYSVPTANRKIMEPSPRAIAKRDELVAKYKDQLDDPVIVAMIDKEISTILWEELKGDSSEGFFVSDTSVNKVRKMTHGMVGGVPRLDDPSKVETITRSLDEGWTFNDIPALVNNLRGGSYDRGKDTQLGGEAAKFSARVYQNTKISEDDCGSKVGEPTLIKSDDLQDYVGHYLPGSSTSLTESDLMAKIGKVIPIRMPTTCNTKNGNFCKRCLGDRVGNSDVGIGPQMSAVGNIFMKISLAKFHGRVLKTVKWNWKD